MTREWVATAYLSRLFAIMSFVTISAADPFLHTIRSRRVLDAGLTPLTTAILQHPVWHAFPSVAVDGRFLVRRECEQVSSTLLRGNCFDFQTIDLLRV